MPGIDGAVDEDHVGNLDALGPVHHVRPPDALLQEGQVVPRAVDVGALLLQELYREVVRERAVGLVRGLVPGKRKKEKENKNIEKLTKM